MRLTIKAKLAATFALVVALSAGSMAIAIQSLGNLNAELHDIVDVRTVNAQEMSGIQTHLESMGSRLRAMILTDDDAVVADYVDKLASEHAEVDAARTALRTTVTDPERLAQLAEFDAAYDAYWVKALEAEKFAAINSDREALAISRSEGSAALGQVEETMGALKSALASRVSAGDLSAFPAYQGASDMFLTMTDIFRQQRNVLLASGDPELQDKWYADYEAGIEAIEAQMPILLRTIPASETSLATSARDAYQGMVAAMNKAVETSITPRGPPGPATGR